MLQGVIKSMLRGNDNLVVMATGGGKSLCYQVPPVITNKPCVVISPLISLMEDQVLALTSKGLQPCFLGSAQASQKVKDDAWAGKYLFIYMTPELAVNSGHRLRHLRTPGSYQGLGALREELCGVPFLALTATATPQVQDDIVANLRMPQGARRWVMSFERPNLHFTVRKKHPQLAANFGDLVADTKMALAAGRDPEATIVYTLTRREAQEVAVVLRVATAFFGMGVDMMGVGLPERVGVA
ncbi:hypothetical protein N2152v2_001044 [Parachlorella kessleri]